MMGNIGVKICPKCKRPTDPKGERKCCCMTVLKGVQPPKYVPIKRDNNFNKPFPQ